MSKKNIALNLLTGGRRETMSARIGRNSFMKGIMWSLLERLVNAWFHDDRHCWDEYIYYTEQKGDSHEDLDS